MKPLKRLHTKTTMAKRKAVSKLKVNAGKHKSSKMAAAAAVVASLKRTELGKDENGNDDKETVSNNSPTPLSEEDAVC